MDFLKIASLLDSAADDIERHLAEQSLKEANVDTGVEAVQNLLSGNNIEAIKIASELYASKEGASLGKNVQGQSNTKANRYAEYDNKLLNYRG